MLMFACEHFTCDMKTMVYLLVALEIAFIIHMIEKGVLSYSLHPVILHWFYSACP